MWSRRSRSSTEPNRLDLALMAARARGAEILELTESNPTRAGIPYAADAIRVALSEPRILTYEPASFGVQSAREAVAAAFSDIAAIGPDRVVLSASTSEAYSQLFKLLCDPGDEV